MRARSAFLLIAVIISTLFSLSLFQARLRAEPAGAMANEVVDALIRKFRGDKAPDGFAVANGRLEAQQIEIATKLSGRISQVLAEEGQMVDAGEIVAKMDVADLEAQLRGAEAQVRRAVQAKISAEALIAQRQSEIKFAKQQFDRVVALRAKGFATGELLDQRRSALTTAQAALDSANANLDDAIASIDAAKADVAKIKATLDDMVLKAPRRGRIQYKLAQTGEVLGAGSRVLTLVDLADVYMTVFFPASVAGHLKLNDDARLILDPIPQYVVPAKVSFVASEAQFTPKTVETAEEREKLMFRVKLSVAPDLLRKYEEQVKAGVRGIGYVRVDVKRPWPANLAVKLPQ
jgi:HlyD family secretion protein